MSRTRLVITEDAFGQSIEVGDTVIWYSGEEARLKRGKVLNLYTSPARYGGPRVVVESPHRVSGESDVAARCCAIAP